MASGYTRRTIFVQLSSCSLWRFTLFAESSSFTCLHAFSNANDLASMSVWWWLFQRIVMIVQTAEILSSNRMKPTGTRPPQIFVGKLQIVASNLTSRLHHLLFIGIREKTIPLKLSAVRSKNSSCSHLGTGTLVFRFAFLYRCWYTQPRCSPHLCIYNAYTTSKMIRTNIISHHAN